MNTCPYCHSTKISQTRSTVQQAGLVRMHCHTCQMGHDQAAPPPDELPVVPAGADAEPQPAAETEVSAEPSSPPSAAAAADLALESANVPVIAEPPARVPARATPAPRKPRNRKK